MIARAVAAVALLGIAWTTGAAQGRAELTGVVTAEGSRRPVANAEVAIESLRAGVRTDSLGRFHLARLPGGEFIITVRAIGFVARRETIAFQFDETVSQDFQLTPAVTSLTGVEVTAQQPVALDPRMRGFEDRRVMGIGHFLDSAFFQKNELRQTGDALAAVPGLRVVRGNGNEAWIASSRGAATLRGFPSDKRRGLKPACYSDVYLDGAPVYLFGSSGTQVFDINSVLPSNIKALEFYAGASQIPVQYNKSGAICGVMLIWTR